MAAQRHVHKHPLLLILLVSTAASLALLCPAFSRQCYPLSIALRTLPAEPAHFRDCLWRRAQQVLVSSLVLCSRGPHRGVSETLPEAPTSREAGDLCSCPRLCDWELWTVNIFTTDGRPWDRMAKVSSSLLMETLQKLLLQHMVITMWVLKPEVYC